MGPSNLHHPYIEVRGNMPGSFFPKLFSKMPSPRHTLSNSSSILFVCSNYCRTCFQRRSHHSSCSWYRGFNYQMLGRGCSISAIHTHLKERVATLSTVRQITGYHPQSQDSLSTMKRSSMLRHYTPTMSISLTHLCSH